MAGIRHWLAFAALAGGVVSAPAAGRDLLTPIGPATAQRGLSSSGLSSSGPAAAPAATPIGAKPLLEQPDPFALQTTFARVAPESRSVTGAKPPRLFEATTSLKIIDDDAVIEPGAELATNATPVQANDASDPVPQDPAPSVVVAEAEERTPPAADEPAHRLVVPDKQNAATPLKGANPLGTIFSWEPGADAMLTAGSGLAMVLGLLLLTAWAVRKSQPRSSRTLPKEVAEVLGRASLGGRRHAQLLRIGNKLVLLAMGPDSVETLCEITDPAEVARLRAVCEQSGGAGSTAAFDELFGQMSAEPTDEGFLGGAPDYDARRLAAAYADTPGGRQYA